MKERLFPAEEIVEWLTYPYGDGPDQRLSMTKRELSFTLQNDIFVRYKGFRNAVLLCTASIMDRNHSDRNSSTKCQSSMILAESTIWTYFLPRLILTSRCPTREEALSNPSLVSWSLISIWTTTPPYSLNLPHIQGSLLLRRCQHLSEVLEVHDERGDGSQEHSHQGIRLQTHSVRLFRTSWNPHLGLRPPSPLADRLSA